MRQIGAPARDKVLSAFKTLVLTATEIPVPGMLGSHRDEFMPVGLTGAVILHLCGMDVDGLLPALIAVDSEPANYAYAHGDGVINYKEAFQSM